MTSNRNMKWIAFGCGLMAMGTGISQMFGHGQTAQSAPASAPFVQMAPAPQPRPYAEPTHATAVPTAQANSATPAVTDMGTKARVMPEGVQLVGAVPGYVQDSSGRIYHIDAARGYGAADPLQDGSWISEDYSRVVDAPAGM